MTVSTTAISAPALAALRERLGDRILLDEATRAQFRSDFGRMVDRMPGAVARPTSTPEVVELVRCCREHRLALAIRGQAHTQSGQATTAGGVLLDHSQLNRIHEIDEEALTATCDGGVVWRSLVEKALERGLVPPVLTNNLGVTISGTLSVAGLGVASFHYGAQVDNVLEIEVVTGAGEVVVCSRERHRDLFDLVRSGLGQFGVITRAKLRLRRCLPMVRKYYLLYDDLGAFMRDSEKVMARGNQRFATLESWCVPAVQGTKKIGPGMKLGEGAQFFAYWLYPMHLTVEYAPGSAPDDQALLAGFGHYRHVHTETYTQVEFCNRLEPVFELWHRSGYWDHPHPWMEVILPWTTAKEYIELVLKQLPPNALGPGGHILLWPSRADTSEAPLFMHPEGEFVMGWGILPGVPPAFLEQAKAQLEMASELSIAYGGKRYLSGFITFDSVERWANHFGDRWPAIMEGKERFDPDGILSPGFIRYE